MRGFYHILTLHCKRFQGSLLFVYGVCTVDISALLYKLPHQTTVTAISGQSVYGPAELQRVLLWK